MFVSDEERWVILTWRWWSNVNVVVAVHRAESPQHLSLSPQQRLCEGNDRMFTLNGVGWFVIVIYSLRLKLPTFHSCFMFHLYNIKPRFCKGISHPASFYLVKLLHTFKYKLLHHGTWILNISISCAGLEINQVGANMCWQRCRSLTAIDLLYLTLRGRSWKVWCPQAGMTSCGALRCVSVCEVSRWTVSGRHGVEWAGCINLDRKRRSMRINWWVCLGMWNKGEIRGRTGNLGLDMAGFALSSSS